MGVYLNAGNEQFREAIRSKIYVDKTGLSAWTNRRLGTRDKYVCVSRPRRFGKTMAEEMLQAYYSEGCDSKALFTGLKIAEDPSFADHLNKYSVLHLNIQEFLSGSPAIEEMISQISRSVLWDLKKAYPQVELYDAQNMIRSMMDIYDATKNTFIILIDEWDCIFREYHGDKKSREGYLDFLRSWLKDQPYVGLAYMTGILPIKKYGTHSALNMFTEFSMVNPGDLAEFVGFTAEEVEKLCVQYHMDVEETKAWYNGYSFPKASEIYAPKSVVDAMQFGQFDDYWNKTETYEALRRYIELNYDGLREKVVALLAGDSIRINTGKFANDMTTFADADDVLTLLVHLGYLAYDFQNKAVRIPNRELQQEFYNAIEGAKWSEVLQAVQKSRDLLESIWQMDESAVAKGIEDAHFETSILQYNDENALSYVISLALYSAREIYTVIREMPGGKGYADVAFIPRPEHCGKPTLLVELKWNQSAETALNQIKRKKYPDALQAYKGNLLLVGINYDRESKAHACRIERA